MSIEDSHQGALGGCVLCEQQGRWSRASSTTCLSFKVTSQAPVSDAWEHRRCSLAIFCICPAGPRAFC